MSQVDRPLPFQPRGAMDGFVTDTNLAKKMTIVGRWGSSCGTPFVVDEFIKKNRQWEQYGPYLHDRPKEPWTDFTIDQKRKKRQSLRKK